MAKKTSLALLAVISLIGTPTVALSLVRPLCDNWAPPYDLHRLFLRMAWRADWVIFIAIATALLAITSYYLTRYFKPGVKNHKFEFKIVTSAFFILAVSMAAMLFGHDMELNHYSYCVPMAVGGGMLENYLLSGVLCVVFWAVSNCFEWLKGKAHAIVVASTVFMLISALLVWPFVSMLLWNYIRHLQ